MAVKPGTSEPGGDERRVLTLSELRVTDLTPMGLWGEGEGAARAAAGRAAVEEELGRVSVDAAHLGGHDTADNQEGPGAGRAGVGGEGCRAELGFQVVMTVNREVVRASAEGVIDAGLSLEVYCPLGDEVEVYRAQEAGRAEVRRGEATAEAVALGLVRRLSSEAARVVRGEHAVRHATDQEVLVALGQEAARAGVLAEAASEAGERKLKEAVPALIRLTGHGDELVAGRAGAALGVLGADAEGVVAALGRMTEGESVAKHVAAVQALGDLGTEEALRTLRLIAVGHPVAAIRELARERLESARKKP